MKRSLLLLSLVISPVYAADLTAHVSGFENSEGHLRFSLFSVARRTGFPRDSTQAEFVGDADIHDRRATVSIRNVPAGIYAVFVYHDTNNNHILDHRWYGVPMEDFGYYRAFKVKLMPPSFDDVSFPVSKENIEMDIVLQEF